jgi:hypothetical protein
MSNNQKQDMSNNKKTGSCPTIKNRIMSNNQNKRSCPTIKKQDHVQQSKPPEDGTLVPKHEAVGT